MSVVLSALVPVLALIALGYGLRRGNFPDSSFWRPAARMVYFVFLPALLIRIIAVARLDPSLWRAQLAAVCTVGICVLILQLSRKQITSSGPAFTSVVQGGIRHNTYIGLAIANAIFPADGVAAFALIVAVIVPLVNAIAVAALGRYGDHAHAAAMTTGRTIKLVALNPLILACAFGALLNLTGIGLPWGSDELLLMLGQPALPVGLLVVGAGLQVRALKRLDLPVLVPVAMRLVLYPLIAITLGYAMGLDSAHIGPLALLAALPTAASAYVLALELGGDEALMARIITLETLAAAVTIPVVLQWVI